MRATRRLLAILADAGILLHPNTPTGLTGVLTHPNPRPHLIYLYNQALDKLTKLPETSAYRQSAEAVTKHRLQIIESAKPNGFEAWEARVHKQIEKNPSMFGPKGGAHRESVGGKQYVVASRLAAVDERLLEWDGDMAGERGEGPTSIEQKAGQAMDLGDSRPLEEFQAVDVQLEDEPPLTAQQVGDIETQIGAGLIEEVIDVAKGELLLVEKMMEARVWEELEEKPLEGQWSYFQRDGNVGITQAP